MIRDSKMKPELGTAGLGRSSIQRVGPARECREDTTVLDLRPFCDSRVYGPAAADCILTAPGRTKQKTL